MKTKECPYCHREISDEAILCKYCHNLLIDEDGNDVVKVEEGQNNPNASYDDDRTRVFSKEEMNSFEDKTRAFKVPVAEQNYSPADNNAGYEDYNDYGDYDNEDYEDEESVQVDGSEARKRLLVTAMAITIGILVIVIAAIFVGVKLFGYNGGKDSSSSQSGQKVVAVNSSSPSEDTQSSEEASANVNDPAETDDTNDSEPEPAESASEGGNDVTSAPDDYSEPDSYTTSDVGNEEPVTTTTAPSDSSDPSAETSETSAYNGDDSAVIAAIEAQIGGNITSHEFRTDDGNNLYYYFFTDDGAHGYSVAYNKSTGNMVIDQNY